MRRVYLSEECEEYLRESNERTQKKFKYVLQVLENHRIVHKSFVEKLKNTKYYELKIKVDNQIRIIIFTIDKENFNEANSVILLNGFLKRTNKDYLKAIDTADKLLKKYEI